MRALSILAGLALLAMPGVATAASSPDPDGEAKLAKMLDGRTAGAPVSCVSLATIRGTTVIDKTAIVYRRGAILYVNRPRSGAEGLNADDVLVTKLRSTQLCGTDKVDQVDRDTRRWRGFVLLGDFIPYTKPAQR